MSRNGKDMLTASRYAGLTVQAGTPMTVTGNGTLFRSAGQGVPIFGPEISPGVRGQAAPPAAGQRRAA